MIKDLKYCPFCGCEAIAAEVSFEHKEFRIYCTSDDGCPASMTLSFYDAGLSDGSIIDFTELDSIMNELVDRWNSRVSCGWSEDG